MNSPPSNYATHSHTLFQVRVVQHKQTRELYALKYINKAKCVKMKAVANIIQERRLLEEVSYKRTLFCTITLTKVVARLRWIILSSSTFATPFKMTKTAFLFWTSCLGVTFDVCNLPSPREPSYSFRFQSI